MIELSISQQQVKKISLITAVLIAFLLNACADAPPSEASIKLSEQLAQEHAVNPKSCTTVVPIVEVSSFSGVSNIVVSTSTDAGAKDIALVCEYAAFPVSPLRVLVQRPAKTGIHTDMESENATIATDLVMMSRSNLEITKTPIHNITVDDYGTGVFGSLMECPDAKTEGWQEAKAILAIKLANGYQIRVDMPNYGTVEETQKRATDIAKRFADKFNAIQPI